MIRILLSARMGEKRINQAQLSHMTGIRQTSIGDLYYEMTDRVSLKQLDRICKALGCDLSELLEYTKDGEEEPHPLQRPDVSRMAPPGVRRMVSNE